MSTRRPPAVLDIDPGSRELASARRWPLPCGGEHLKMLISAVSSGSIGVTMIMNSRTVWTPRCLPSQLPDVVIIADDSGQSRDPAEWRCAMSVTAWARAAIVHGAGAEAAHYQLAAEVAQRCGRLLFIETGSARLADLGAWLADLGAWLQPRQILITAIVPRESVRPLPTVRPATGRRA